MKSTKRSLAMALALSFGVFGVACSPAESENNGGSGGSSSKGGSGGSTGGRGGSTGGSSSTGGSTGGSSSTGGSGGSTGGSGGSGGSSSTGGSGGSTGGSGGSTGGSGGSGTGGSGGSTGGSGGSSGSTDAGKTDGSGGMEAGGNTGAFTITIDHIPHPTRAGRLCFKPEASNSGGNKSPKMDWTTPPAGTQSFVLTTFDMSNNTPHQIVCNIPKDVMGRPADTKTTIPPGAQSSTGHNKAGNMWYGPGRGRSGPRLRDSSLGTLHSDARGWLRDVGSRADPGRLQQAEDGPHHTGAGLGRQGPPRQRQRRLRLTPTAS